MKKSYEIENPDIVLTASCHDKVALENFFKEIRMIMQKFDMEAVVMTKDGIISDES